MWTPTSRHAQKCVWIKHLRRRSAPWIDFMGLQEKVGYGFNCKLLGYWFYDWSCYGIQIHTHPTRSASLVNNLHYKKEKKKSLKGYSRLCIAAKVSSLYSSVGRYGHFSYRHIASLWDRRYTILSWMGGCGQERDSLYFYLVIFKPRVRERESLEVPITEIIYFQTYWKTNMLNIKIFKTASSYSATAVRDATIPFFQIRSRKFWVSPIPIRS